MSVEPISSSLSTRKPRPVRVLIVEDSSTMRAMLRYVLSIEEGIEVVGEAADPYEARGAIKRLSPDVITLDIEMPKMNGLDFLEKLMAARPTPVVMVASATKSGAEQTMRALELGALDFIAKPSSTNAVSALVDLPRKVISASKASLSPRMPSVPKSKEQSKSFRPSRCVVAIGSSTGGVEALRTVLSKYPENCPPTVIVQHMPAKFTAKFAQRLNKEIDAAVYEAEDGMEVKTGHVYIAPGGERHLQLDYRAGMHCRLREGPPRSGHSPSVDEMFDSVAKLGNRALGVILTGMGADGAEGLMAIREAGGRTIGQNQSTSVIYGMPRVAFEKGAVERQLPLNLIGPTIIEACNANR